MEQVFTGEQQQAIDSRTGSLLLSAGAGSGKTAVLVERTVQAVLTDQIDPSAVLAITFTEKAAAELSERIKVRLSAATDSTAVVGTIHSFCAQVLRANALLCGIDPYFTVATEQQARHLIKTAYSQALNRFVKRFGRQAVELITNYNLENC